MQSNLLQHQRTDTLLEKVLVTNIQNKFQIVDGYYNIQADLSNFPGIVQAYAHGWFKDFEKNYIAFHNMGHTPFLEDYKLNSAEVNICNKEGLYIFPTEQVFHTAWKKQRLILDGSYPLPDGNLDWQPTPDDDIWSPELDSIEIFITSNKLTNVTVCSGFKDESDIYNKYNFKYQRCDPMVNSMATELYEYKRSFKEIDTKLWCGNIRYMPHRHLVTAYTSLLDTQYSWCYKFNDFSFVDKIWFDIQKFKNKKLIKGLQNLNSNLQSLDIDMTEISLYGNLIDSTTRPIEAPNGPNVKQYTSESLYGNTFCSIINSSTFGEPFPLYDEKPLSAICNYKPFVMVGPPGTLKLMQEDGFKTFSNYWSEEYDTHQHHETRLECIFNTLEEINNFTINEIRDMYKDMQDILIHNKNNLSNILQPPL